MVDVVSNIGGEAPVVNAVLEQVTEGHGRVREAMHVNGLQQPLGIVETPTTSRNAAKNKNQISFRFYLINPTTLLHSRYTSSAATD